MTENALALIEGKTELVFATPQGLTPLIEAVKAQVHGVIHDISTKKGREACISLSVMVRDTKTEVERRKLALTEDMRSKITVINTEGKRAWEELEKIQKDVRQPVTDWENADKLRLAGHEKALSELDALQHFSSEPTSEQIRERLIVVEGYSREWQEFAERADTIQHKIFSDLEKKLEVTKKREDDAAELERLRQEKAKRDREDNERRIADEAAEKARKLAEDKAQREKDAIAAQVKADAEKAKNERLKVEQEKETQRKRAEKAEADRKAFEKKAEEDKIAAAAQAKRDQEAAVQAERNKQVAEDKRKADELTKREADEAHVKKIQCEVFAELLKILSGDNLLSAEAGADAIMKHLVCNTIPHIKITY